MARYDQDPDFASPLPGVPGFNAHDGGLTAHGSADLPAAAADTGPVSVTVTVPGASDVNADQAVVGAADTLMANQAAGLVREPVSGVGGLGDSGAGQGSVWPPDRVHPNAMNPSPGGAGWASHQGA